MAIGAALTSTHAHDLLRVHTKAGFFERAPSWVRGALTHTPWVVVRRDMPVEGHYPVGVRGTHRSERWGTFVAVEDVAQRLSPEDLVERIPTCRAELPAEITLREVASQWGHIGVQWGPTGSAGFQLATGYGALHPRSDVDIVIRSPTTDPRESEEVWREMAELSAQLPARVDIQIELGYAGCALSELLSGESEILLKTPQGPILIAVNELSCPELWTTGKKTSW